ncbi:DNA polymerase alpha subunit B N-terminal-domain-containing protein [Tuber borchii]|uniref:DNA polymerase alpha subunit B N-terminal-domain-containing protein n=1 Tax=Tuber borchii TaxID=42251 RepID=A0A2T6ZH83_TUBBO|nr:DNA polymerase alpha subunit B N-terminal-domain-containing protein [Tuber borchii]
MDNPSTSETVTKRFGELAPGVLSQLVSKLKICGIPAKELFLKLESCIKMGLDDIKLNLDIVHMHGANTLRAVAWRPRVKNTGDHEGLFVSPCLRYRLGGAGGGVPNGSLKAPFEMPSSKAGKLLDTNCPGTAIGSSPVGAPHKLGGPRALSILFAQRKMRAAWWKYSMSISLSLPSRFLNHWQMQDLRDSRIKLVLGVELKKFSCRPMYQKLSDASEVIDNRVDKFRDMVQELHELANEQFGNPSTASPSEIIAVG